MAIQFSYYEHYTRTEPAASIEYENFLEDLRTGRWEDQVHAVRNGKAEKTNLPLVTISGLFTQRAAKNLTQHSGLLCIDIDNEDPEKVKNILSREPYVSSIFTTARGYGAAVIIKIQSDSHLEAFQFLEKYFFDTYKIIIDRSCKDVSRARFVSWDPNLYYNPKSEICKKKLAAVKQKVPNIIFVQTDFDNIVQQIIQRQVNLCESYDDWLRVGFAISTHMAEAGRPYFHQVSGVSGKYSPEQCDKQFTNCLKARGHGVTMGTFYWMSKKAGLETYSAKTKQIASAASAMKNKITDPALMMKNLEKFGGFTPLDTQDIVQQIVQNDARIEDPNLIEQVRMHLHSNYNIRENAITRKIEVDGLPITDRMANSLYLECKRAFKNVTSDLVDRILNSQYTPQYNPLLEFFDQNKHLVASKGKSDPCPAVSALFESISSPTGYIDSFRPDYVEYFGTRWLVGLIAASQGEVNPLVMVLSGDRQNTGKTEFFRRLLPPELQWLFAQQRIEVSKDFEILMTKKWLIVDDEWGGKSRKELEVFKSLTSSAGYSIRSPFGRHSEDLTRLASLGGTSNNNQLLGDPTGNRRIIPVGVDSIDHDKYNAVDKKMLLMEAWHLYNSGFRWRMDADSISILNDNTKDFVQVDLEQEALEKYFKPGSTEYTTTDVKVHIELLNKQKLNLIRLGACLRKFSKRVMSAKTGRYVYLLDEVGAEQKNFTANSGWTPWQ